MPRFFFHVSDGKEFSFWDETGQSFRDRDEALTHARTLSRELGAAIDRRGSMIVVTDESRTVIGRLAV
jgi:hypothetical protein